jgi:hypothetical protein
MEREKFDGVVWEPACGNGAMSEVIMGYNVVVSSDIVNRGYGDWFGDFLLESQTCENIITNPPFKYAQAFVEQAKKLADKKIAMFLKLVFLESSSRYKMFQDKSFPLKTVYVFCKRVPIYKAGMEMKNSGLVAYAWFVWDKKYQGKPYLEWIS